MVYGTWYTNMRILQAIVSGIPFDLSHNSLDVSLRVLLSLILALGGALDARLCRNPWKTSYTCWAPLQCKRSREAQQGKTYVTEKPSIANERSL